LSVSNDADNLVNPLDMKAGYKKPHEESNDGPYGPYHEPKGNDIEKSLLQFLLDIGVDVHAQLVDRNRNEDVACYIPFSNKDKIKITARSIPDPNLWDNPDEAEIYVVVQGTPEMIHNYCNVTYNSDCQDEDFSGADKKQSLKRVDDMAKKGLVPVSYGYKKMTYKELSFHMEKKDVESEEFKEDLLTDLTYLCTFGLENPLRLKVHEDVSLIKYGIKDLDKSQAEGGLTSSGYGEMQKSGKKTRK